MDIYNYNNINECKNINDLLEIMRSDENEHIYSTFSESYLKV